MVNDTRFGVTDAAHATARGAIAAMAMTGFRTLTKELGLVGETPPEAIVVQRVPGLLARVPPGGRRGAVELAHWTYGAVGGAVFGLLPERVRRLPWAGPAYGLALWFGFEFALAPALGLRQATVSRPSERLVLAIDHLLYGLVLSETRSRPRR
jgi:hypothetical protein